ncbi:MAG TPA: RluA family pseudouridine synthase [Pirellulales bacterium]|nr:RluA family pseudouridine synthase [Pirellulales bacterium]
MLLEILYEDNHLLAVAKPPGLPTQGAAAGRNSLLVQAKNYLRRKYHKPGNIYLGVVSRLDLPTSGVVLFARTSKAAARLSQQFRNRHVEKTYWAVVEGAMDPPAAECTDWLAKDERNQRMVIVSKPGNDSIPKNRVKSAAQAQEARLQYRRVKALPQASLLEIMLETGRKHQIRVQLAARGYPIIGDRKYGSRRVFADGIALHCRRLVVEHPVKKTPLELIAPPPKAWKQFAK